MTSTLTAPGLPLTLTPNAEQALAQILAQEESFSPEKALRIGVTGGGCAGMSYVLKVDETTPHDELHMVNGMRIAIDRRHLLYLINMVVDFQDGLNARGFTFQNPNATSTCGCGTSFSA